METLRQDIRYALRQLTGNPGFALMAVLTLALGIGANSAIFTVVNGVLLRSLPFDEPDRLVMLYTEYPQDEAKYPLSPPDFMSFHEEADVFSDVAAYSPSTQTMTDTGEPTRIDVGIVSADFFELMGVAPVLGRTFRAEENQSGQTGVALLGDAMWRQEFGADPDIIGRTLTLNGVSREVIGVLPEGFDFPAERDLYYPLTYGSTFSATTAEGRRGEYLSVVARLAPGVSQGRAEAAVGTLSDRLRQAFPETNEALSIALVPLRDQLLGDIRTPLLVLLGAVGLVLLIACANVANLLLTRAAAREGELAVRAALGAKRGRLLRQLMTESVVLGLLGGAVGLLLAVWGTQALVAMRPEGIPRLDEIGVDGTVVLFTAAVALLAGILFGLIPAIQITRGDLAAPLKEGGRGALSGRGGNRVRSGLIVGEMALAVMLLIGAGLLIRSFLELTAVDPGFRAEQTITYDVSLPASAYEEPSDVRQFYADLLDRMEALPGVESASAVSTLPLAGAGTILTFRIEGREPPARGEIQDIVVKVATPDYFPSLAIPVREGRPLNDVDRADAPGAVVINEAAARRFFPNEEAVGERLVVGPVEAEIVGVVGNVRQYGLDQEVRPELYVSHAQFPADAMTVVLRTAGEPSALAGAIRREVRQLDPNLPIEEFTTLGEVVSGSVAQPRFYMALLTLFAAVALLLAAIGIFGVMSYSVAQRTREIGVRMALGARAEDVLRLVVRRALWLALGGLALGLLGALALSRILRSLLYDVGTTDPLTFTVVPLVLMSVAALASYLPARRATRVDPMTALRHQ